MSILDSLRQQMAHFPKGKCAVALSGGGDSMALCFMLKKLGYDVVALHFNHNIRPESENEARWLADLLSSADIPVIMGMWPEPVFGENLQAHARRARYQFFKEVCQRYEFSGVYIGHTEDDVLETFFIRLSHGSGLKGLAHCMPENSEVYGVKLYRPMLGLRREDLRAWLQAEGLPWLEDPSNLNDKFFRVRMRKFMPKLKEWGLDGAWLSSLLPKLAQAEKQAQSVLEAFPLHKGPDGYTSSLDVLNTDEVYFKRWLIHVCQKVGAQDYPPRSHKILRLKDVLDKQGKCTLGGVIFSRHNDSLVMCAEQANKAE